MASVRRPRRPSSLGKSIEEEEEEEEEIIEAAEASRDPLPGQMVKLSKILEFDVHHFSKRNRKLDRYVLQRNHSSIN